jgi:hypothetical protein
MSSTNENTGGSGISFDLPKKTPTFPGVLTNLKQDEKMIEYNFESMVRFERNGKMYKILIKDRHSIAHSEKESAYPVMLARFISYCYSVIFIFKVDESNEAALFDDDQTPEAERLIKKDPTLQF